MFNFPSIKYIFPLVETYESNFSSLFNLLIKVHCAAILFQQMMTQPFLFGGAGKDMNFYPTEIAYLCRKRWESGGMY